MPKNIRDKIIPIEKKGKYDLAILDKVNQELLHVIELKKLLVVVMQIIIRDMKIFIYL